MRARIYLVLFLLLVLIAGSGYACSEAMRVREVVVLGCEVHDPAEVVDLASIANEESVFALRFDQIGAHQRKSLLRSGIRALCLSG